MLPSEPNHWWSEQLWFETLCLPKEEAAPPKAKTGKFSSLCCFPASVCWSKFQNWICSCLHLSALESLFYCFSLCVLPELVEFTEAAPALKLSLSCSFNPQLKMFQRSSSRWLFWSKENKTVGKWTYNIHNIHCLLCHRQTRLWMLMCKVHSYCI